MARSFALKRKQAEEAGAKKRVKRNAGNASPGVAGSPQKGPREGYLINLASKPAPNVGNAFMHPMAMEYFKQVKVNGPISSRTFS